MLKWRTNASARLWDVVCFFHSSSRAAGAAHAEFTPTPPRDSNLNDQHRPPQPLISACSLLSAIRLPTSSTCCAPLAPQSCTAEHWTLEHCTRTPLRRWAIVLVLRLWVPGALRTCSALSLHAVCSAVQQTNEALSPKEFSAFAPAAQFVIISEPESNKTSTYVEMILKSTFGNSRGFPNANLVIVLNR